MDDLKRRVLRLIDEDRIREGPHFRKRCEARGATLLDAVKALRNGVLQPDRFEGENFCFLGTDTKDRRTFVVARIDDEKNYLYLVTLFR